MLKRRWVRGAVMGLLVLVVAGAVWFAVSPTTLSRTVLDLSFDTDNGGLGVPQWAPYIPLRWDACINAVDQAGHVYVVARSASPSASSREQIVLLDLSGAATPRKMSLEVPGVDTAFQWRCYFLAASADGACVWAIRTREVGGSTGKAQPPSLLLTAHSPDGKLLQRWALPRWVSEIYRVAALEGGRFFIADAGGHLLTYTVGRTEPVVADWPMTAMDWVQWYVSPDERAWLCYRTDSSPGTTEVAYRPVGRLGGQTYVWTATKEAGFAEARLSVFSYVAHDSVVYAQLAVASRYSSTTIEGCHDKFIYRVAADGHATLLASTRVLPDSPADRLDVGTALYADATGSVWVEATRTRSDGRRYQIVKLWSEPRWRTWWQSAQGKREVQ